MDQGGDSLLFQPLPERFRVGRDIEGGDGNGVHAAKLLVQFRKSNPATFIRMAIGFIGLSTLAQARGLILTLTNDVSKTSVQPDVPATQTEPHRSP
jgi:hypothetical protein